MIRRCFILLALYALISSNIYAQPIESQLEKAERYEREGKSNYGQSKIAEALECHHNAAKIYKTLGMEKKERIALADKALMLFLSNNKEDAYQLIQEIQTYAEPLTDSLGVKLKVKANYNFASFLFREGKYKDAIEHLATFISSIEDNTSMIGSLYGRLLDLKGSTHRQLGENSLAVAYYEKALRIYEEYEFIEGQVVILVNMATITMDLGYYTSAEESFSKALNLVLEHLGTNHPYINSIYLNLGVVHGHVQDFETAKNYFQTIIQRSTSKDYITGIAHFNLGDILLETNKPEKALKEHQKALLIYQELFGEHPMLFDIYNSIAKTNLILKDYDESRRYTNKAQAILDKFFKGYTTENHATVLYNLALFHVEQKNYEQAKNFCHQIIEVGKKMEADKKIYLPKAYDLLAQISEAQQDIKQALVWCQQSIISSCVDFDGQLPEANPTVDLAIRKPDLLKALIYKGKLLMQRRENSEDLLLAVNTFKVAEQLSDEMREQFSTEESALSLVSLSASLFEEAIPACYQLYKETGEVEYMNQAFRFSEKSRTLVLREGMKNKMALRLSGIPLEVLKMEEKLRKDIGRLMDKNSKSRLLQDGQSGSIINELAQVKVSYDSLLNGIGKQYPNYYKHRYSTNLATPSAVQRELLADDENLIKYFMTKDYIYVFVINTTGHHFLKLSKEGVQQDIQAFNLSMKRKDKTFGEPAFRLYQKLIKPIESKLAGQKIIIVPDGELGAIPMELFCTSSIDTDLKFRKYPYLLKKYQIGYLHSVSLALDLQAKSYDKKSAFLAMAPSYALNNLKNTSRGAEQDLYNLPGAQQEAQKLSDLLKGEAFIGEKATESSFKNNASNYNILHLAMHALVDDQNPSYSKLVFYQEDSSTLEDGFLHTYELYNMELNAQLVTLSACNTGWGKVQRGEGIMSLARGITFAGCPSLVASLWAAEDQSTAKLMEVFYAQLLEGKPKDEALRVAKLDYLQNANNVVGHPYYWGSFVMIGDREELDFNQGIAKSYLFGGGGVLLLLCALLFWKKKSKKV